MSTKYKTNKYGLVLVKFRKNAGVYQKGQHAGFAPHDVERLEGSGTVEVVEPVDPDSTLDPVAVAQGDEQRAREGDYLHREQSRAHAYRNGIGGLHEAPPAPRARVPKIQPFDAAGNPGVVVPAGVVSSASVDGAKPADALSVEEVARRDEIAIPPNVIELHHTKRIKLAKEISGADVANADEANAIIAAEVERREDAEEAAANDGGADDDNEGDAS